MSWLYTIIFAGLAFSSQGNSVQNVPPTVQPAAAAVERQTGDETEKFDQTYPFTANGKVSLSNVNGSIVVEAWDRNEVRVEYTKTADSKERLADVEVRIDAKADSIKIDTDYGNWKTRGGDRWSNGGRLQVEFHLMVPRGGALNEIEAVNGSVTVSNFINSTKVSAVNGSVNATNLRGTANLSTVNGEVRADFDRLEAGSKIILSTVNGHVNLVLPSDSSATINADSLNGNISNDFGLPVRKGKYVGRDLYGKIGAGDVRIKLDSVNGALAIGRKNDGKALSPATNLLPQKEKDDEDWDNNDDNKQKNKIKTSRINAEVDRSVRESQRDVERAIRDSQRAAEKTIRDSQHDAERAMADAQKTLNQIQPEIAKISDKAIADAIASTDIKVKLDDLKIQADEIKIRTKDLVKLANIDFINSSVPKVEKKGDSIPVKGVPKVMVDAKGASVSIQGWDKSEIMYRVTKFSSQRNGTPLNVTENHTDCTVNIKIDDATDDGQRGLFFNNGNPVRVEIFVPRKSNLKITAKGEIRLDGVSGDVDLAGGDESVNVRDGSGILHVASGDGRIRIIGFSGELDARTSDGEVYLEGDFTKLTGKTGDGKFILTVSDEPNIDIEANTQAISVENLQAPKQTSGNNWRFGRGGPKYRFTVNGGDVTVRRAETN